MGLLEPVAPPDDESRCKVCGQSARYAKPIVGGYLCNWGATTEHRFEPEVAEAPTERVGFTTEGSRSDLAHIDMETLLRESMRRTACEGYVHPDAGESPRNQRIGAPCARCGRMGSDHRRSDRDEGGK